VSKKKRRYAGAGDGYDLDLTYISDRIIAMGYPATGLESIYRNRLADVRKFLNERHQSHYKVYNLCSERQCAAECFSVSACYPFDDHNCPPFDMLCKLMADMEAYLAQDAKNVAVIHCKAGKGRTGLVVAAHLLHSGKYATSKESLHHFGFVRTHNAKGVTIPSHERWVNMYEQFLIMKAAGQSLPSPPRRMRLKRIELCGGVPRFDEIVITCGTNKWSSKNWRADWMKKSREDINTKSIAIVPSEDIEVMEDVHVAFNKRGKFSGRKKRVFGCWLNMQFLDDDGKFKLSGQELDGIAKKMRQRQNFTLELHFSSVQ